MSVEDRLRSLAEALPPGGYVVLTRDALMDLLSGFRSDVHDPRFLPADLTVRDVARRFDRAASTVRGWIRDGRLEAYRFGREYRIAHNAIENFEIGVRAGANDEPDPDRAHADMSDWRRVVASDEC